MDLTYISAWPHVAPPGINFPPFQIILVILTLSMQPYQPVLFESRPRGVIISWSRPHSCTFSNSVRNVTFSRLVFIDLKEKRKNKISTGRFVLHTSEKDVFKNQNLNERRNVRFLDS